MMNKTTVMIVGVLALAVSACTGTYNKGQTGAAAGAAGGAIVGQIIGENTEATLIGAAVGGLLGYIVGNEMDKADRQQLNSVYETGPSGQSTSWSNHDSGNT